LKIPSNRAVIGKEVLKSASNRQANLPANPESKSSTGNYSLLLAFCLFAIFVI